MCNYQGKHFGAWYEDAACIDGYLWDLDSCDEPGGPLFHGGDIACPRCNTREYAEDMVSSGNAKQRRTERRKAIAQIQSWAGTEADHG